MGIFYRLFILLENTAHKLDLKYAVKSGYAGASYERQLSNLQKQSQLKDDAHHLSQLVNSLTHHMILLVRNLGTPSGPNQQVTALWLDIQKKNKELNDMVKMY